MTVTTQSPVITAHMYGIRNCSTVKRALDWCQEHGLAVKFHDYKKEGVAAEQLQVWCAHLGWQALINRRGTTWRRLPAERQAVETEAQAIVLMLEFPSLIKRPLLQVNDQLLLGFAASDYEKSLVSAGTSKRTS